MNLNHKLPKIGIYILAKEGKDKDLLYSVVGGMASQIHGYSQFKDYLRPTIDVDVQVLNQGFKDFKKEFGTSSSKLIKNKFNLPHHITNGHNSNGITLMNLDNAEGNKTAFMIHFTRYQPPLYDKIKDELLEDLETNTVSYKLNELGINPESIRTHAKIGDIDGLEIKVRNIEGSKDRKFKNIIKKADFTEDVRKDFLNLRSRILNGDKLYSDLPSLYEQIVLDHNKSDELYKVEKDIYDYFLLTKVDS
jgi:hypothetical protein